MAPRRRCLLLLLLLAMLGIPTARAMRISARHNAQEQQQQQQQQGTGSKAQARAIRTPVLEAQLAALQGPPPGYKHAAFRLIVPQHALATLPWHDALRHAAFLSLRRAIDSRDGNAGRAEQSLWHRVSEAPVSPQELAKPVDEDADITTLASGVMVRQGGRLAFLPEAALLQAHVTPPLKVTALWSVLRVRHSGPGLSAPRVDYYFTVQPASHLSLIDHVEKYRNKIVFKKVHPRPPTHVYKEVPVFSELPGQYYNPQFLSVYRNTVNKLLHQQRPVDEENLVTPQSVGREAESEPYYVLPTPRYTTPKFPRLSTLLPSQDVPKLVNIVIPRRTTGLLLPPTTPRFEELYTVTTPRAPLHTLRKRLPQPLRATLEDEVEAYDDGLIKVPTIKRASLSTTTGRSAGEAISRSATEVTASTSTTTELPVQSNEVVESTETLTEAAQTTPPTTTPGATEPSVKQTTTMIATKRTSKEDEEGEFVKVPLL